MKHAIVFILLFSVGILWSAETDTFRIDLSSLRHATDQCMDLLSKGRTSEGLVNLFTAYRVDKTQAIAHASSLAADFRVAAAQVESKIGNRLFGQYEFLGTRRLGMSYLTLAYLQKHEYGALPTAFLFYKGQNRWFINNTTVGDHSNPDLIALDESGTMWPGLGPLKQATDDCMSLLSQGRMREGFAALFKRYSVKATAQTDADSVVASFKSDEHELQSAFGERLSGQHEFLGLTHLGHSYATLVYIQKHERGALTVAFTFYQGPEGWHVVNASWSADAKKFGSLWATEGEALSPKVGSLKQATDRFMNSLSAGQIGAACTNLYQGYWPDKEDAASKAEALTMRIRHLTSQYRFNVGKRLPGQYEFIGTKRLGSTYVTLFYVQKHEFGVSPVSFQFYQGAQTWILTRSSWGDEAEPDQALWKDALKQPLPELSSIKQAVDQCMKSLSKGEILPGLTNLAWRYWAVEAEAIPRAETLAAGFQGGIKELEPVIGKPLSGEYELEGVRCLGTGYAFMVYIIKHEYGGFIIRVAFWQGQSRWYLRAINIGNEPQNAIELFSLAERAR